MFCHTGSDCRDRGRYVQSDSAHFYRALSTAVYGAGGAVSGCFSGEISGQACFPRAAVLSGLCCAD